MVTYAEAISHTNIINAEPLSTSLAVVAHGDAMTKVVSIIMYLSAIHLLHVDASAAMASLLAQY